MYEAADDVYCYPGTAILKNRLDIRNQEELEEFEKRIVAQRSDEPVTGRLDVHHYKSIHRHLFQDVYDWAGECRSVRLSKDKSMFCYPENISREMDRVFRELKSGNFLRGRSDENFAAGAAHFLAELNAIHPFREGNGRTQNYFLAVVGNQADHPLDLAALNPDEFLSAMIRSFNGNEHPLAQQILRLLAAR